MHRKLTWILSSFSLPPSLSFAFSLFLPPFLHCHLPPSLSHSLSLPLAISLSLSLSLPPSLYLPLFLYLFIALSLPLSPSISLSLSEAVGHSSGLWGSDPGVGGGNGLWLNELCLSLKRPPITKGGWTSYGDGSRTVRWHSSATAPEIVACAWISLSSTPGIFTT